MNLSKISWKNLMSKRLSTLLTLLLFALGTGLIIFLLLFNSQLQEKFDKNLAGIDLVIGAKGSPLQLILCNMYHIDAPTGNIKIDEAKAFLNPKHPLIKSAIPLSLGDSYKGYRIVGTTYNFLHFYGAEMAAGGVWTDDLTVVIGADVAKDMHLHVGDTFLSNHGLVDDEGMDNEHPDHPFRVNGILARSGTVLDQLVLTSTASIWNVHAHEGDGAAGAEHSHDHADHDHDHTDPPPTEIPTTMDDHNAILDNPDQEITSILVKFKGRNFQALNMQRSINENTGMQAASPAIEMNRLYQLMGVGEDALRAIAFLIIVVSGLSIFISLYNSLKERKYELALIRTMGGSRSQLLIIILLEGLFLAAIGFILGWLLGHIGMQLASGYLQEEYNYTFSGLKFLNAEWFIFILSLAIGVISSLIPAYRAYKTDIVKTLTDG